MRITQMRFYDGARERICRLGLAGAMIELEEALLRTEIRLDEPVRIGSLYSLIDGALARCDGWEKSMAHGVDRIKMFQYGNVSLARLGVQLKMPSFSNMSMADIIHLRRGIIEGLIDVGVVVVPDDRLQIFLPDRTPAFKDAVRYIEDEFKEAMNYPFIVMALEHDGPGEALPKQARRA